MFQIVFRIPGLNLPVYGYGLMLVVAFLVCAYVARAMAGRIGLDGEAFINAALIAMLTGIVGARVSDVLENWHEFFNPQRSVIEGLFDAVNIRSGGLTFYGGFILATPCCIVYGIRKRLPILRSMDIVAPVLMIGLGLGRIGCYLNGCCYGELCRPSFGAALTEFPYYSNPYIEQFNRGLIHPAEVLLTPAPGGGSELKTPQQVHADGLESIARQEHSLPVQPTQLYSCLTALLLAALLLAYWTLPHLDGRVFALMMMIEGPSRFLLEMLRVEPPVFNRVIAGFPVSMSLSMVIGLAVFAAGGLMWLLVGALKSSENTGNFAHAH